MQIAIRSYDTCFTIVELRLCSDTPLLCHNITKNTIKKKNSAQDKMNLLSTGEFLTTLSVIHGLVLIYAIYFGTLAHYNVKVFTGSIN